MTQDKPLSERWEANKDRPAWVQANRDELAEATGMHVPRSRSNISTFLGSKKGAVTKKLNEEDNE